MPPDGRIFGADRVVLYLENPTITLSGDLDGSKAKGIRKKTEQFIDSPESAFDKHPKEYVGQIRHLDTKMRAFATWCQNEELLRELCVVQEIYRKSNEKQFWRDIDDYNEWGNEYFDAFSSLDPDDFDAWMARIGSSDDVIVVD